MNNKKIVLLSKKGGFTLIEVMVAFIILAFAAVGIYLGVLYAESQLKVNYHERVATLLASGEMEWQFYTFDRTREFDYFDSRDVIIDDFGEGTGQSEIIGTMSMSVSTHYDYPLGRSLRFQTVRISVTWNEPLLGERTVMVQEDFF